MLTALVLLLPLLLLIAALVGFHDHQPLFTARNQAIAVTVSGALQLLWLWWACRRAGVTLRDGLAGFLAERDLTVAGLVGAAHA